MQGQPTMWRANKTIHACSRFKAFLRDTPTRTMSNFAANSLALLYERGQADIGRWLQITRSSSGMLGLCLLLP